MSIHLIAELDQLKRKLLAVAGFAEESIRRVGYAVKNIDTNLAREVIQFDHSLDLKEVELEEDCLKILALHQPVASDLRFVVSALKINNDLERIGDLAVNIAERVIYLSQLPPISQPFDFNFMWRKAMEMVKMSIDSLVTQDVILARQVLEEDDIVDSMHREMYGKVFAAIKIDTTNAEANIHYLSISRCLERIADYATNISEDVIYMIEGRIIRHTFEEQNPPHKRVDD